MAQENEDEFFIGKIAQKIVIEKDGCVLAMRNPDETQWNLMGGRLHKGETLEAGLRREVREEIGVEIEVGSPIYTDQFINRKGEHHVSIGYAGKLAKPQQEFTLAADEVAEIRWVPFAEVQDFPFWDDCKRIVAAFIAAKG